ncbi:MAG: AIDA repeat-containing protein [Lentisphaeria bacterium]|nr:MAG: AIDA repeat-containing protein [Lentisphaeria bacterium]
MWVDSDGSTTSTTVNYSGYMRVSNGGSATSTTVNSGGYMRVSSGGSATSTTVNSGGDMWVSSDGSATSTTVNAGGTIWVYSDSSATSTTVKVGGAINGFTISEDRYLDSDLHVSNASVSCGAVLYAGQTATSTTVNSGGAMRVSSGGSATSTTVNAGGTIWVSSGGSATSTTVNAGGTIWVYSDSSATSTTVKVGGAINGFTISEDQYYYSDFHVSNAYVNGNAYLYSDQTATSTTVNSGGHIYVSSGGGTTSTTVNSGGSMTVSGGGSTTSTTVNAGGYMTVSGTLHVFSTLAISTTVNSGGHMWVGNYGSATSTTVNTGGIINGFTVLEDQYYDSELHVSNAYVNGGAALYYGQTATSTTVNSGGFMRVDDGSTTSTTVNFGGNMAVYEYGSATSTTVNSGGCMYVSSGGCVNNIQIAKGGKVVLYEGSRLDFRIADQSSAADVLVNDWSLIVDKGASYTITVDKNQWNGVYQLAGGWANFNINKDITIWAEGGGWIGTFIGGWGVITSGDYTYTLGKTENGTLTLTVQGGQEPPEVPLENPVIAGGNAIQIMADGTVKIHSAGGVTSPGRIDPNAWTLLDSGDFNRDGKDGLLWLEKATGNVYMQDDLSSMAEVTNKSKLLGVAGGGYEVQAAGDFFGTGFDGALLLGPAFGNESLNYGLATWSREQDGSTTPGWLGALVNTWEESGPLNSLKGDFQNLTGDERNKVINANNYRYELVGVGDFNGDGKDDVMLRNTMPDTVDGETITGAGDVFVFLTDTRENVIEGYRPAEGIVYTGCATDGWDVVGFGDFNGDGIDDVVISDGTDLAGWQVSNGQRTEDLWFGSLTDGWKFAGVGDFDADGTDDILLADPDNNLAAWKVKDGQAAGIITLA